jgi:hypothetical protein
MIFFKEKVEIKKKVELFSEKLPIPIERKFRISHPRIIITIKQFGQTLIGFTLQIKIKKCASCVSLLTKRCRKDWTL